MQTLFDHRPTQMFAQDGRRSLESERKSELLLSLSDSLPRQPLARSAPCFAGFLSERTDKAMSSGKSSENASSESSNYVRGKVLFWLSRVYDRGLRGIPSVPCLRLAQEPRRGWNCASNEEMWRERRGDKLACLSVSRSSHRHEQANLCGLCVSSERSERVVKRQQLSVCVCG